VRDHEGNPGVIAWLHHCRDAQEAEGISCLEGLKYANRWLSHVQVVLESDCVNIIAKIQSCEKAISCYHWHQRRHDKTWSVLKIWREQNMIAHNLADYALKSCS
jgi:hypothetical protein